MPAYLIVNYKVEDPDLYGEYAGAAGPVLGIGTRCKLLVFDRESDAVEGHPAHQTVMLEFESKKEAREAYESKAYQEIIGKRLDSTSEHFAILVNGIG